MMHARTHEDRSTDDAGSRRFGRRDALRLGSVAAAIGAGTVLLRPQAAGATTGVLQFGQVNDSGSDATIITSTNTAGTLQVSNEANAPALLLRTGGAALVAVGVEAGVRGETTGAGPAVLGVADVGTGPAVRGEVGAAAARVAAIEAAQNGTGTGVSTHIDNAASNGTAVHAQTRGTGTGITASSALGIGGKFSGHTAPIQLVPSSAGTHPAKGAAGQLFVDHSNRLWFCKGGSNWHQLA